MELENFNNQLLRFLDHSPTPFHAVASITAALDAAGYARLDEHQKWELMSNGRYYVTRNSSSLIAFATGNNDPVASGIRMVGAHTDSPCLKIKPKPEIICNGYLQLGVEVYGGALLNPWFDRDLSIAGRVTYRDTRDKLGSALIDFRTPVAVIPSLAIHLDPEVNKQKSVDPQKQLPAIVLQTKDENADFRTLLLEQLRAERPDCDAKQILDYELCLYDTQAAQFLGLKQEFIASARLDNLLSCYSGMNSLLNSDGELPRLLVCNDHEEVGNTSAAGAQGPFLRSVLQRWCGEGDAFIRAMDRSMLISADNAHGIHPNFSDQHDKNHGPLLNHGPVIKVNSNQRYATNSETSSIFRSLCEAALVPVQSFVVRTDLACGTTIGPVTSSEIGVRTLDVGVPQFAMHSIRELSGVRDAYYLYLALKNYFNEPALTVA